jgi:hypothetical protein
VGGVLSSCLTVFLRNIRLCGKASRETKARKSTTKVSEARGKTSPYTRDIGGHEGGTLELLV